MIDSQRALEEMAGLFATTKLELDSLQDLTRQPENINSIKKDKDSLELNHTSLEVALNHKRD